MTLPRTEQPLTSPALSGVREAVRRTPAYPFTPIDAPIKLDQNESPLDLPAELRELALERLARTDWNRYPDLHADTLRRQIAAFEDWDPEGVVVTPGSNVLIKLLTELAGVNQTVLSVQPNFSVYGLEASMLGARTVQVPLNGDFSLPVEGLIRELNTGGPGLLFVTQPHAPTGHLDAEADVKAVLDAAGNGWVAVLDEAYYQFSGSDGRGLVRGRDNRISLRTFSKAWGLAGLRLGYALTSPELAQNLQKLVSAFNINILTQTVVLTALEHPDVHASAGRPDGVRTETGSGRPGESSGVSGAALAGQFLFAENARRRRGLPPAALTRHSGAPPGQIADALRLPARQHRHAGAKRRAHRGALRDQGLAGPAAPGCFEYCLLLSEVGNQQGLEGVVAAVNLKQRLLEVRIDHRVLNAGRQAGGRILVGDPVDWKIQGQRSHQHCAEQKSPHRARHQVPGFLGGAEPLREPHHADAQQRKAASKAGQPENKKLLRKQTATPPTPQASPARPRRAPSAVAAASRVTKRASNQVITNPSPLQSRSSCLAAASQPL